ncbi:hypothetical protein NESM_000321400 [Novymonas esmeraldas]|uniref:Uncharacterized protein n=1 Tax=Novymonas esmeraldas TaxID=1808958 RepID=A0AAW0EJ51_9TRYP
MSGPSASDVPLSGAAGDSAAPMRSVTSPSTATTTTTAAAAAAGDAAAEDQSPGMSAPPPTELRQLRERLRTSDEWNVRLQHQLQDLLQLPRNEVLDMRHRMQDPDVAIPLLQCYDAVIAEKTEEVARLRREVADAQQQLSAFRRDELDVSNAVRMAEELARSVQGKAAADVQQYVEAVRGLQEELVRLRMEMTRALDAEHTSRQAAQRATERVTALETALEEATRAAATADAARDAALRQVKQQTQQAGEEQTGVVVQRVQLQLASQEKADQAQELERLRARMALALRQSSDNHAAHLRIVEERHRMIVEDLRSASRTQELELLKVRAQLARWDPSAQHASVGRVGGASTASTSSMRLQSTAELLDAQTRQAQAMEVQRLYGEVAALQLQRDDAVRQYEQLNARLQRDRDQELQEAQRQLHSAQRGLAEARTRCEELEETRATQEAALRKAREELRLAQQEAQQHRLGADSNARKLASVQQQLTEVQQRLSALQDEKQSAVRLAQERASELEANVARALQDVQGAKERAYAEVSEVQRRYEQLRLLHTKTVDELRERDGVVAAKERERAIAAAQLVRLEDGLAAHKTRVATADRRVQQLEQQLADARLQQRGNIVSLEQLKLQNSQLTRTRDQLTELLQARSY